MKYICSPPAAAAPCWTGAASICRSASWRAGRASATSSRWGAGHTGRAPSGVVLVLDCADASQGCRHRSSKLCTPSIRSARPSHVGFGARTCRRSSTQGWRSWTPPGALVVLEPLLWAAAAVRLSVLELLLVMLLPAARLAHRADLQSGPRLRIRAWHQSNPATPANPRLQRADGRRCTHRHQEQRRHQGQG